MEIFKALKYLIPLTLSALLASQASALSVAEENYKLQNCAITPDHDELVKLALEFNNTDKLNSYLIEKYGCPMTTIKDAYLDEIISKYPYKQVIINTGNTRYEGLESCAYHPQREEFVCSVSVRQRFGFSGYPAIGAGSNEWVTICVDYGGGMEPVDTASVHVHNEQYGNSPYWYYGVVIQGNEKLQRQVQKGQTLKARALLSWATPATHCRYRPVWGNQADFQIKLDP
ncbi:hypothetical protein [Gynuella sp.]|uniref:hypothetical protein n=1 Tax=Gynuella sp. TaxID=2969146 RepID=UPI003D0C1306